MDERPASMGKLAGFGYKKAARRLWQLGFQCDRQAAGDHEIWWNPESDRYTTIPNHPGINLAGDSEAGGRRSAGVPAT
jgi:predicted RNA binding protein YcfA (HicA-like mRNA interferase family)